MRFATGFLVIAALSFTACSKDGSGGGASRLDVTRFQVELLSEEQAITSSDYSTRLRTLTTKSKACRKGQFGTLKKGDIFVVNTRANLLSEGSVKGIDMTMREKVNSVREREFTVSGLVESISGLGMTQAQIVRDNKYLKKCSTRKSSGVSCKNDFEFVSPEVETKFSSIVNPYKNCSYKNERDLVDKFSTGIYTLQDGRKVPVLVRRSQATFDMSCAGTASQVVIVSRVTAKSNQLKNANGKDCFNDDDILPYNYSLVQKDNLELIQEYNTRVLLAPSK